MRTTLKSRRKGLLANAVAAAAARRLVELRGGRQPRSWLPSAKTALSLSLQESGKAPAQPGLDVYMACDWVNERTRRPSRARNLRKAASVLACRRGTKFGKLSAQRQSRRRSHALILGDNEVSECLWTLKTRRLLAAKICGAALIEHLPKAAVSPEIIRQDCRKDPNVGHATCDDESRCFATVTLAAVEGLS